MNDDIDPTNTAAGRDRLAKRFEATGLDQDRFIYVEPGAKRSENHTMYPADADVLDAPANYGVYATADDALVLLDVDDYDDSTDQCSLLAVEGLPDTLTQHSPHGGTHRFYVVETGDDDDRTVAAVLADELGRKNPQPSWGEVRTANQYVVGAGSQLDDCDKDNCDDCANPEGGWYTFGPDGVDDRPIATLDVDTLLAALRADPKLGDDPTAGSSGGGADEDLGTTAPGDVDVATPDRDAANAAVATLSDDELLERAKNAKHGEEFRRLWRGDTSMHGDDHSAADQAFCNRLAFWTQCDTSRMDRLFRQSGLMRPKWDEQRSNQTYGEMTIEEAVRECDKTYTPGQPADPPASGDLTPADVDTSGDAVAVANWGMVRHLYDGGENEQVPTKEARRAAVATLRAEYDFATPAETDELLVYKPNRGVFEPGGRHEVERTLDRHLGMHYTRHEVQEIVAQLKAASREPKTAFDAGHDDRTLLCVGNGVLDLETRELHPHSPKYLFQTTISWDYDPDAECPNIEQFMDDITAREADKQTLYEMIGNCLTPHYDYESFLVLFGEGENGKSTYFNVVTEFLGQENVTARELQALAHNNFAASSLVDKMANIAPDLPSGKVKDMGPLKALTGGDTVMAEPKGQDAYEFENRAKLMFGANRPPVLSERTHAIARRLLPIELPYQFTSDPDDGNPDKRDRSELVADLTTDEEMSGLLNKALDGLDRLRETGDFSLPESPEERLALYQKNSDPVKEFAITCVENAHDTQVTKDALFNAYKEFCRANDHDALGKVHFYRQIRQPPLAVEDGQKQLPDSDERPRIVKNVAFTAEGEQYVPETIDPNPWAPSAADESADAGDADADADGPTVTPLADVDPSDDWVTVEVEAAAVLNPASWLQAEGTVADATGKVNYEVRESASARGQTNPAADIEQGDRYRIRDACPATDGDGARVLKLRPGVTTVESIGTDSEQTGLRDVDPSGDAADEQADAAADAPAGDSADPATPATDGGGTTAAVPTVPDDASGAEADKRRILRYLAEREAAGKPAPGAGEVCARMDERHDFPPDRTTDLLDALRQDGRVLAEADGYTTNT